MELDKIYIRTGLEYDMNNKKFREDLQDIEFQEQQEHMQEMETSKSKQRLF
jgi:hypothetical protein